MLTSEGLCKQKLEVHRGCVETWACVTGYRQVTKSGRPQSRDPGMDSPSTCAEAIVRGRQQARQRQQGDHRV